MSTPTLNEHTLMPVYQSGSVYVIKTVPEFERILAYWRERHQPQPVFVEILPITEAQYIVIYDFHCPQYMVQLITAIDTPEQAPKLFDPIVNEQHGFIHHD